MRVNIDEIKEGGLDRAWDLPRETVDEMVQGDPAAYRARSPLHVEGRLRKVERRVLLDAHARAALTAPCGRCLVPVELEVPLDFEITFVPADEGAEVEQMAEHGDHAGTRVAGSFAAEAADEEIYSGKVIDLDPVVREQLLLTLPRYPVCQESCKGLCSVCGANLNERDCGCDRHVPDPRWAGLEKLKKK
jgi:DUF177 domain-containing protein